MVLFRKLKTSVKMRDILIVKYFIFQSRAKIIAKVPGDANTLLTKLNSALNGKVNSHFLWWYMSSVLTEDLMLMSQYFYMIFKKMFLLKLSSFLMTYGSLYDFKLEGASHRVKVYHIRTEFNYCCG